MSFFTDALLLNAIMAIWNIELAAPPPSGGSTVNLQASIIYVKLKSPILAFLSHSDLCQ